MYLVTYILLHSKKKLNICLLFISYIQKYFKEKLYNISIIIGKIKYYGVMNPSLFWDKIQYPIFFKPNINFTLTLVYLRKITIPFHLKKILSFLLFHCFPFQSFLLFFFLF